MNRIHSTDKETTYIHMTVESVKTFKPYVIQVLERYPAFAAIVHTWDIPAQKEFARKLAEDYAQQFDSVYYNTLNAINDWEPRSNETIPNRNRAGITVQPDPSLAVTHTFNFLALLYDTSVNDWVPYHHKKTVYQPLFHVGVDITETDVKVTIDMFGKKQMPTYTYHGQNAIDLQYQPVTGFYKTEKVKGDEYEMSHYETVGRSLYEVWCDISTTQRPKKTYRVNGKEALAVKTRFEQVKAEADKIVSGKMPKDMTVLQEFDILNTLQMFALSGALCDGATLSVIRAIGIELQKELAEIANPNMTPYQRSILNFDNR